MNDQRTPIRANQTIRVKSTSDPQAVGGALAHALRKSPVVNMSVIGAAAVNQAIKAAAIATVHMAAENVPIALVPSFVDIMVDGTPKTSIKLKVIRLPLL